jgi:prepilin-type N-terminal cleavage/methylation domain-containing protein
MTRRAFTLVEAVIAMVVLSIAVPATLAMIHDATLARAESAMSTRASWLGSMVAEQILADVASDDPQLGMDALEDATAYLDHPDAGLFARLEGAIAPYREQGLEATVEIGPLVSESFTTTGDDVQDIYRQVVIAVQWNTPRGDQRSAPVAFLVTDPTP